MQEEMKQVASIKAPVPRAKAAIDLIADYQSRVIELSRIRREAIEEATGSGMTHSEIAEALGVSRGRVGQLASAGPPPERAFFGLGPMTVALGGKHEAGKRPEDQPGGVVMREDYKSYENLRDLFGALKLDSQYEVIPPPGMVSLNREHLVVVCGPRLSPIVAQVLESDDNLRFAKDHAWYLEDMRTNTVYRSPFEDGVHGDVGYLGRLPRPDGKGTFIYMAGIHAIGASGVVHYLEKHLAEVYKEVRTKRFSTLIASKYNPDTLEILESSRITPIYKHEA